MRDDACARPVGLILAGGLARRMGGGDKSLRMIGGRPMLDHAIERLAPQCSELLLNANGDPRRFAPYGLPVIADTLPGFLGPLAGILAGLEWAAAERGTMAWVVCVAGDMPFLPKDLVERLHETRQTAGGEVACAASGGRRHPVVSLWPAALRHDLHKTLLEGERKVDAFISRRRLAVAEWPADPYDPFFNANDPQDLAEVNALAGRL